MKGGKPHGECHTTLERVVAQRAKGKFIKDSDFNPSVVDNESLVDTAIGVKIEVWTDSSSAKAIIQRLGPGRRAKHLEVQTMWVQQLNKLGLISMNKLGTLENVADMMTKHVLRGVLDKLAEMMGYSFPGEETARFQDYSSMEQSYWNQKLTTTEKLPIFDDQDNEELEHDVHSFVDKTTHLTTTVLRRGVEMSML